MSLNVPNKPAGANSPQAARSGPVSGRTLVGQPGRDPRRAHGRSIPQLFLDQCKERASEVCMRAKHHGIWQPYTWRDVEERVCTLAAGLGQVGLARGEVLGIISENIVEVYWAEHAGLCRGATVTCMYPDSSADEMAYILDHAQVPILIAEDQEQVDKVLAIADRLPHLRHVIYIDGRGLWDYDHPLLIDFAEFMDKGRQAPRAQRLDELEAEVARIENTDLALLCYTSGTTGKPKGVMLTHKSLLDNAYRIMAAFNIHSGANYLSYISPAWAAEQIGGLALGVIAPMVMNFAEKPETVQSDLRELGAEFLLFTPRQWEMMASGVQSHIADSGRLRQALYAWALRAGHALINSDASGLKRALLKAQRALADVLILSGIRDNLGLTHTKVALSAGSGLSGEIFCLYHAYGIPLRNLYGSTEIGLVAAHWGEGFESASFNPETMGQLLPTDESVVEPLQARVDEQGQLFISGGTSFCGYYRNEEATAKELTPEGEYCTGDVVRFVGGEDLIFLDRLKDMRRLANGHHFPPQFIETHLRASSFIKDVMILGDETRPYVAALINIDSEIVGQFAERQGLGFGTFADMSDLPEVRKQVALAIERLNALLEPASQVARFANFPKELDPDDNELTRSRKLRRNVIAERYAPLIEALYDGSSNCDLEVVVQYRDGSSKKLHAQVSINQIEVSDVRTD